MRKLLTYTALRAFQTCPRRYAWRYVRGLEPVDVSDALHFGTLIHKCLEARFQGAHLETVFDYIDRLVPGKGDMWVKARAMMRGYYMKYPDDSFEVLSVEPSFQTRLRNPATGYASRKYDLAGKVDAIVRREDGSVWIVEHKTTRSITTQTIAALWSDMQIQIYSRYASQIAGEQISGVIYDVLEKPHLRRRKIRGTEEHEDDAPFYERLADWHEDGERYMRLDVQFSDADYEALERDLWQTAHETNDGERSRFFRRTTSACHPIAGFKCPYIMLCQSGTNIDDNHHLIENYYRDKKPHKELEKEEAPF